MDPFYITIPDDGDGFVIDNRGTLIAELPEEVEVQAGTQIIELLGYPIDPEMDDFILDSWQTSPVSAKEWVTILGLNSEAGIGLAELPLSEDGLTVSISPPYEAAC